ncbi:MAG: hypothetical protein EAZ94_22425 [Oscillatoriales cyanobacterium]|nr:MAG: hypothetical protein EAZ94_22425 [Oscillatoriales cyanobacterium]TAE20528.1 MAG: hypothetical protein EAZ93_23435 [Oscillatoriales cyanobacterium]
MLSHLFESTTTLHNNKNYPILLFNIFGCGKMARSPFIYTRCQTSDRPFGMSQNVRSLFPAQNGDRTTQHSQTVF